MTLLSKTSKKIRNRIWSFLTIFAISTIGLITAQPVLAQSWVENFLGPIILKGIFFPFIILLNMLTLALVKVASYGSTPDYNFASAAIVERGWPIVRDISNMFFVLILLIIAIGTIVKWEKVNYRQNLRRLVIMALLINFSKTIVIFFIDISQIFTLTFISEVNKVIQVGIITALGLDKIANPVSQQGFVAASEQVGINLFTYIMAGIMVAVACLTVAVMLLIFLVRILSLWMIIVFAPLAFLSSALPQTREWYEKWWKTLGSNLTVAPVLAFMLWLVFAVIADKGGTLPAVVDGAGASAASTGLDWSQIVAFGTAIGLLILSVKMAISMSAAGGSLAAKLQSKVTGAAKSVGNRVAWGKSGQGGVLGRAKSAGLRTAQVTGRGMEAIGGVPFVPMVGSIGGALNRSATVARGIQKDKRKGAEAAELRYMDKRQLEAKEKGTFLGMKTLSAPASMALAENKMAAMNQKNEKNKFVKTDAEVRTLREQYRRSGASEKEIEDFDKKTNLRGLDSSRYTKKDLKAGGVPSGKKAGDYKNEAEGKRVAELMTEMNQEGKLSNDVSERDVVTSTKLSMHKRSEAQMLEFLKNLDPELKDEVLSGYEAALKDLTKQKITADSPEDRMKKKLEAVMTKSAPDRAMRLVASTAKSRTPVDFEKVANRVEKDDLGKMVDTPEFATNVHLLSTSKASEIMTGSDRKAKETYFRALAAKANEKDASGTSTTDANAARRTYTHLAEATATQSEMGNQVTTAKSMSGTPHKKNAEDILKYHDDFTKEQAERSAQKELTEAEGKIKKSFAPGQKVRHYGAGGAAEEDWNFEGPIDTPDGMKVVLKKNGATAEVPLREFRKRNFF